MNARPVACCLFMQRMPPETATPLTGIQAGCAHEEWPGEMC
ncbi:MAG: hypothetical protein WCG92_23230 [Hyphomicrobiales bacterium]|nr:hypothetical protein [Alphaproteobacteria bacterium]